MRYRENTPPCGDPAAFANLPPNRPGHHVARQQLRRPGDSAGDSRRPRVAAWGRVSRYRVAAEGGGHQEEAAEHVSPVQGAGGCRYHDGADGSRADVPLHDGRRAWMARRRNRRCLGCSRPANVAAACTGRIGWAAIRCRICLVFGKRAGEFAAKKAKETSQGKSIRTTSSGRSPRRSECFGDGQAENPYQIHEDLRAVMQSLVGIVRTDEDLRAALVKIGELRVRAAKAKVGGNIQFNPGWHLTLDLKNMLDISEAVTKAALERTESRGGHTREDFPRRDKEWGKVNCIVRQNKDGIGVKREPLPEMPAELAELLKKD